jgi:hypothetical protein
VGRAVSDAVGVLDIVQLVERGGRHGSRIFFSPDTDPDELLPCSAGNVVGHKSVGGCTVVDMEGPSHSDFENAVRLPLQNHVLDMTPSPAEPELFAGLNCVVAERNGESVETLCAWLMWHQKVHCLQAALIIERGPPQNARQDAESLRTALASVGARDLRVVMVTSPLPLGRAGSGPERHPMNAPDAPGKDRMEEPSCDRWSAPLAALSIYELLRHRFLSQARAVLNIDVHDLVPHLDTLTEGVPERSVFDRAAAAPEGLVVLSGERIYPWGVRKRWAPTFGDHICRRFDRGSGHGRWTRRTCRLFAPWPIAR